MTDAPAPVIHAHWVSSDGWSMGACGIRFEWDVARRHRWLTHDMAKVTCEACRKLVAAAGLAVGRME